jgi:hypothetical protein
MNTTYRLYLLKDYLYALQKEKLITINIVKMKRKTNFNLQKRRSCEFVQVCSKYKLYTEQILPLIDTSKGVYIVSKRPKRRWIGGFYR